MIENYLQMLGILIPVLVALLAAFWKLVNKADNNKTKFQQDIMAARGTILSSEIIPQLIMLIEKVETERDMGNRMESIEDIIGRTTHGYSLQLIVKRINELNDLDILLTRTISFCFNCAYDMLLAAAIVGVCIIWLFVNQYWINFITIVTFAGFIILFKLVYDTLMYSKNVHRFIQKHNEIQLGRNGT